MNFICRAVTTNDMTPLPWLADPDVLELRSVVSEQKSVTLLIRSTQAASRCPGCGQASPHVHSRYQRFPDDLPWQGVRVTLKLSVRRFFYRNASCERRIFCERLANVLTPYARQTLRLVETLQALGFGLGGEAATRTARLLGISSSADTFLRRVQQSRIPAVEAPRVIGVDDWAYREAEVRPQETGFTPRRSELSPPRPSGKDKVSSE